jgi:hypothetical protein
VRRRCPFLAVDGYSVCAGQAEGVALGPLDVSDVRAFSMEPSLFRNAVSVRVAGSMMSSGSGEDAAVAYIFIPFSRYKSKTWANFREVMG